MSLLVEGSAHLDTPACAEEAQQDTLCYNLTLSALGDPALTTNITRPPRAGYNSQPLTGDSIPGGALTHVFLSLTVYGQICESMHRQTLNLDILGVREW